MNSGPWLETLLREIRYASRRLVRSPGFAATAVLSLAMGIGANAAIFSLVDQALLRRLPVNQPERLVHLDWRGYSVASSWGSGNLMSYPLCRDLQERDQFFDGVFCRHPTVVNLLTGQEHEPVRAELVSGSFFPVLGVHPWSWVDCSTRRMIDSQARIRWWCCRTPIGKTDSAVRGM